ncbi:MAG: phage terminase large subunit family protein [Candidatus Peribacteraceae bacterium]|nr:phage terminase large subunit family protein [Candidatus Peribacteraceae bacterium]
MEYTPLEIAEADAGYWAILNKIKLQRGLFSFENREYQIEPMWSTVKRRCYMKATRGGFSEVEILKSLHGMIHERYKEGVLYLFPTTDDVGEFSKSRFGPLLSANKNSIGRWVKSSGKGTDTTSLKKIHNAFLYLRGARLSEKRGDEAESSKMKSIGVDKIVFDEVDHMDEEVIAKARGRYYDSPYQEEVFIGNPIVPGLGIDKQWQLSDQRHWYRKCHSCGEWTCAELFFMEDQDRCIGRRKDGTGYIACKKCGREIFIKDGKWQSELKENSSYMHGYRWSQLSSAVCDPLDILHDFNNPPEGNLSDVYRLRLGLPYIATEDRLVESQIYECCGQGEMLHSHPGPCAMGVDVGITKHIVIGARTGNEQYSIIKMVRLSAWEDIHDLAKKFHVKSAVIDIRPYQDIVKKFQSDEPYRVFLCEYSNNPAYTRTWDTKRGIVKDYRTALFDETHRLVDTPGMLIIPRYCLEVKEFAKQMCNAYKILEKNKVTGARQYNYKGDKEHYRNAMNYFILAASKNRIASIKSKRHRRQEVANNNYVRV